MMRLIIGAAALSVLLVPAHAQPSDTKLEFEVASIKPMPPQGVNGPTIVGMSGGPGSRDPGTLTGHNMTLLRMVTYAYDLLVFQVVAPGWANDAKFQLTAKVPQGATREQVRMMVRNLLADRFQLKTHFEKRELPVFELVAGKGGPKFKPATDEPPAQTPADAPPQFKTAGDGYPVLTKPGFIGMGNKVRMWQPKLTMADFGKQISGELGKPVIDATGLKGEFDIRLFWVQENGRTPAAGEAVEGPTLAIAIQEQLGLKLDSKKSAVDVLVIDSASKVPTDN